MPFIELYGIERQADGIIFHRPDNPKYDVVVVYSAWTYDGPLWIMFDGQYKAIERCDSSISDGPWKIVPMPVDLVDLDTIQHKIGEYINKL